MSGPCQNHGMPLDFRRIDQLNNAFLFGSPSFRLLNSDERRGLG